MDTFFDSKTGLEVLVQTPKGTQREGFVLRAVPSHAPIADRDNYASFGREVFEWVPENEVDIGMNIAEVRAAEKQALAERRAEDRAAPESPSPEMKARDALLNEADEITR